MRTGLFTTLAAAAVIGTAAQAQQPSADADALREGRSYIATRTFTAEEDRRGLDELEGLAQAP